MAFCHLCNISSGSTKLHNKPWHKAGFVVVAKLIKKINISNLSGELTEKDVKKAL
ncbi:MULTISPECIES: hypothetical protein [unclassified Photorhabdus]|uniref:hypothetical protein n=1 Tax=unclassified Photorhabdus TaxID=2620880 RepID=UPI0013143901|nr:MULTISPECIES: hypothetical protein [unclassified Photorhabdus]